MIDLVKEFFKDTSTINIFLIGVFVITVISIFKYKDVFKTWLVKLLKIKQNGR